MFQKKRMAVITFQVIYELHSGKDVEIFLTFMCEIQLKGFCLLEPIAIFDWDQVRRIRVVTVQACQSYCFLWSIYIYSQLPNTGQLSLTTKDRPITTLLTP